MKFNNDKEGKSKQSDPIKLGLRPNIRQFLILVLVNAFAGAMIGLEQTVIPLIGKNEFETIKYVIGQLLRAAIV
jgi:hypothetical protein